MCVSTAHVKSVTELHTRLRNKRPAGSSSGDVIAALCPLPLLCVVFHQQELCLEGLGPVSPQMVLFSGHRVGAGVKECEGAGGERGRVRSLRFPATGVKF